MPQNRALQQKQYYRHRILSFVLDCETSVPESCQPLLSVDNTVVYCLDSLPICRHWLAVDVRSCSWSVDVMPVVYVNIILKQNTVLLQRRPSEHQRWRHLANCRDVKPSGTVRVVMESGQMSATRATDDDTAKWTSATAAEAMMAQMLLAQCDTPPYNALTAQLDVLSIAVSRYKILKFIVLIFEISQCFTRDDSTKKIILTLLIYYYCYYYYLYNECRCRRCRVAISCGV